MSNVGIPKSPENSGNKAVSGSISVVPRRVATPNRAARAWTQAAQTTRRRRARPRSSDARIAPKTNTTNAGGHGRNRSARLTGSARRNRNGSKATTADAVPRGARAAAKSGGEDRAQDTHDERGGPRPESIRQVDRIREEKPQRDQGNDGERRPEEGAAGCEGDSFRALADEQETMARQRGESGVLGRGTQEDGRDEVEDGMAPRCGEEEARQEQARIRRVDGRLRHEGHEERGPCRPRGEHECGQVVHMKPG